MPSRSLWMIPESQPRSTESRPLGLYLGTCIFSKFSKYFLGTVKFQSHWPKYFLMIHLTHFAFLPQTFFLPTQHNTSKFLLHFNTGSSPIQWISEYVFLLLNNNIYVGRKTHRIMIIWWFHLLIFTLSFVQYYIK